ncbi:MAG: cysteine desulfurase [Deltaproteobacteria bacterium]|nr:cysteine desulfurase [Deltaproteobacteria bacterium]
MKPTAALPHTAGVPRVYFDNNATTPLDARVRAAMEPYFGMAHGNPSSAHGYGRQARQAVEAARSKVATLIGAESQQVIFTGSGTEANNAVIFDAARRAGGKGHFVLSAFEHPSIDRAIESLEEMGFSATRVPPEANGVVAGERLAAALQPETILVCLMLANNELGTLQPVVEVAALCREKKIPLLCDAVQAVGKVPVTVTDLGVDYLVLGAHKFHGPLGAAALWIRPGSALTGLLVGAPQEFGFRAGTENVPAVVGLGEASHWAREEMASRKQHLTGLRDRLETGLEDLAASRVHCRQAPRLPHTTNVAFPGWVGRDLMLALDLAGYAVSTGAACGAGDPLPSQTLLALGLEAEEAIGSLRISFGIENTQQEVDDFLCVLPRVLEEQRGGSLSLGGGTAR